MDLNTYKELMKLSGVTVGEQYKNSSDYVMEATWDNDIQSKHAYIYTYDLDDQKDLNVGMTYDNTTKIPIDIKFIISEYGSLSKDQPSAKIMFHPSIKHHSLSVDDNLYFLQERAYEYDVYNDIFIGAYIDIPDEHGIYHKWMICQKDISGNQFQKYFVLPCGYKLQFIRFENGKRIKQELWAVLRSQSSYNSGSIWFAIMETL